MESFFIGIGVSLIAFFSLDQYLYRKYKFSLRDSLGIHFYFDEWEKYNRAQDMLLLFPTQNKIDLLVKYGVYAAESVFRKVDLDSQGNVSLNFENGKYNAIVNFKTNEILFLPDPPGDMERYDYTIYQREAGKTNTKKLIGIKWSTPFGSAYTWRKYFDSSGKPEQGGKMCSEIIKMRKG